MSLAQQFTWGHFLKKNPDFKKKKIKRTSPEGEKAFKAAFKEYVKSYLKDREAFFKKEKERAAKAKKELVTKLKALDGRKWHLKAKVLNQKIGRYDAYLAKIETLHKKTASISKTI